MTPRHLNGNKMTTRYEVQRYDKMYASWHTFVDGYTERKDWAISRAKKGRKNYPNERIRVLEINERVIPVREK